MSSEEEEQLQPRQLKLYCLEQTRPTETWGVYTKLFVFAYSAEEAMRIHPKRPYKWNDEQKTWTCEPECGGYRSDDEWAKKPTRKHLIVKEIPIAEGFVGSFYKND